MLRARLNYANSSRPSKSTLARGLGPAWQTSLVNQTAILVSHAAEPEKQSPSRRQQDKMDWTWWKISISNERRCLPSGLSWTCRVRANFFLLYLLALVTWPTGWPMVTA